MYLPVPICVRRTVNIKSHLGACLEVFLSTKYKAWQKHIKLNFNIVPVTTYYKGNLNKSDAYLLINPIKL